ncbi:putative RNA-directed DNA polymerase from transposon X-element [Trichonephila clavipes]|nr:putative RNA-directed DNA polymerase from transposon X-element [Trichonephila clavipes]
MRMIERQLQTAVNNIVKWCDSNGHSISASKSCCVHFCRKRGIHPDPGIRIRDVQLPVVPDVRFLGVIFDRRERGLLCHEFEPSTTKDPPSEQRDVNIQSSIIIQSIIIDRRLRLIERQLQTTVNGLVQWCDQNGHTISPSKSSCVHFCRKRNLHPDPFIHIGNIQILVVSEGRFLGVIFDCKLTFLPHVLYLRKRCERSLNILKVLSNTLWGADRVSLLRVYHALILSRLDYGCAVYGSARASVLKRLDTVYHSALRICSGAFRTSPVTSLYVVCHQPPLELRRRQLCANYLIRAMSVPSHPLKPFALAIGLNRLYAARSFNIKPFSERAKSVLNDAHLININIQENNILAFPPWDIKSFNYHNPFSGYDKAGTADVIYQQLFSFHRKRRHPTVIEILVLLRKLEGKGFHIIFSWVPGHVGIFGNEQADTAARSMSDHMQRPVCYRDLKTSTQNYIHRVWQETWDQQILNKLHSIHPFTSHWAALPVRRHDVRLTRLRIGHTRFTHRHLLLAKEPFPIPTLEYATVPLYQPFATYSKSTVAPVVFQRVFAYHRSQYSRYSAIYTDGSKRADYVGCGVVIEDILHGYRLDTSCSIFTAEAFAIYRALPSIDSNMPRKYCIYTDSMSVLEALENYHDRCHPVVCTILDITSRLYSKGFDIVFCWLPSHVGIIGNEQADSAAKSATTHLPLAVPLSDMKRVIMHHIFNIWQESWSQQLDNKPHSVKPVIGAWPVMPLRRTDVKLTRLRIGHTLASHTGICCLENVLLNVLHAMSLTLFITF